MLENLSAFERSNCCLICRFAATELFSNHGLSQYVDPSNYGDPMEAVKTFAAEIDRNQIKLERTVGGGVYRKIRDRLFLEFSLSIYKFSLETSMCSFW